MNSFQKKKKNETMNQKKSSFRETHHTNFEAAKT